MRQMKYNNVYCIVKPYENKRNIKNVYNISKLIYFLGLMHVQQCNVSKASHMR